MKISPPKQYFAAAHRAVANSDTIEWEELPSLAASLAQRLVARGALARSATGSLARLVDSAEAGSASTGHAAAGGAAPATGHAATRAAHHAAIYRASERASERAPERAALYVAPWQSTELGTFYELEPSAPFNEVLFGVSTREVHEPDVFQHFFGSGAHRN